MSLVAQTTVCQIQTIAYEQTQSCAIYDCCDTSAMWVHQTMVMECAVIGSALMTSCKSYVETGYITLLH